MTTGVQLGDGVAVAWCFAAAARDGTPISVATSNTQTKQYRQKRYGKRAKSMSQKTVAFGRAFRRHGAVSYQSLNLIKRLLCHINADV